MIWSRLESWSVEICVEISELSPWSKFQSICWLVIAPSIAKVAGCVAERCDEPFPWDERPTTSFHCITGFTWRNIKTVRITRQDLASENRILRENWKNRTKYHDIFDRIYLHSTLAAFLETNILWGRAFSTLNFCGFLSLPGISNRAKKNLGLNLHQASFSFSLELVMLFCKSHLKRLARPEALASSVVNSFDIIKVWLQNPRICRLGIQISPSCKKSCRKYCNML